MKTKNKTKVEDDWEEFDDCPICQAMKKAKENGRDLTSDLVGAGVGGGYLPSPQYSFGERTGCLGLGCRGK